MLKFAGKLCWLVVVMQVSAVPAFSQPARGMITSSSCPLSCEDLQVPRSSCRESQAGSQCTVEDLTQPAGFQTMVRLSGQYAAVQQTATGHLTGKRMSAASAAAVPPGRRGLVTSSNCPFTCLDAGVPAEACIERGLGSTCEVEDLRYGPGHQSLIRVPK